MIRLSNGCRFPFPRPSLINTRRLDMAALPLIEEMNRTGLLIDPAIFATVDAELAQEELRIAADITSAAGRHINPESGDQVAHLLFDELGLSHAGMRLTPTGDRYSTEGDVLAGLRGQHILVDLILDHREASKLRSTYTGPLPLQAGPDGRVRTTLKATTARTGRLASEEPNCFDGKTEVLTYNGWVPIWGLVEGVLDRSHSPELVAQWSESGVINFVEPTGYVRTSAEIFVAINNEHIDLRVTPNHRCLLVHRKSGHRLVVTASDYRTDYRQLGAGMYGGGPGLSLSDDEIRLLVATQADGSWFRQALDFGLKKSRKVLRLRTLLKSCGVIHTEAINKRGVHRFYIPLCPLTKLAELYLGNHRQFGPWVFHLSRHQINVFLGEVHFWDGCWTRKNHYASKHKSNADWVQALFVLSGVRTNLRQYVSPGGSVSWQTDVTNRNYSLTTNARVETSPVVSGGEWAYCIAVPSTYLLVRRNGKVMVTGNCQNIPTRGKWGTKIRSGFVARRGCKLVSSDLSQIEMRVAAHESGDANLCKVFWDYLDIHTFTAINLFHLDGPKILDLVARDLLGTLMPWEEKALKEFKFKYRLPAKTLGFATLYGVTGKGLQLQILAAGGPMLSVEECQMYVEDWFKVYPGVRVWMELQYGRARRYEMVWDFFGRQRYVPEVKSVIGRVVGDGLRQAGNHPIQSGAQGIIKTAMYEQRALIDYFRSYPGEICDPCLQIHDETIFECSDAIAQDFAGMSQAVMSSCVPLDVPTLASGDVAENWGALK